MKIELDDGLQFGLGVFETICLMEGRPVLPDWHLERMNHSLETFGIEKRISEAEVERWLLEQALPGEYRSGRNFAVKKAGQRAPRKAMSAMKILVTEKNTLMLLRSNPYTEERIQQGFCLEYSPVRRNETSPLVCHKTLNYGDNILEKRRTAELSADELIFLNTRGELTEGSTTNLFLVKEGRILTPAVSCGLLPGIMRRFVIEHFPVEECILFPEDVQNAEECFVTNSLMGIMPVRRFGEKIFADGKVTGEIRKEYRNSSV